MLQSTGQTIPRRFSFHHADLRRPGAVFVRDDDRTVVLKMDFGDLKGSLPFKRLVSSLNLPPDSPDRDLLELVPDALRFMRQIGIDDPVPGELFDGRPSWLPKPHVLQRAVVTVSRAIQGRLAVLGSDTLPAQSDPATAPDPLDTDMRAMARSLLHLVPDITTAQAEARLQMVVTDLARVDWLRRAITTLQRMVGELAQFSARHSSEPVGDLSRRTALQLRQVTIWGTSKAIAADAAVGDINRLLAQPELLRLKAWPAICALRALILDVEPVLLRWQAACGRSDGRPRQRDIEDLLRLALQRYAGFDPDHLIPRPDRPAGGFDD